LAEEFSGVPRRSATRLGTPLFEGHLHLLRTPTTTPKRGAGSQAPQQQSAQLILLLYSNSYLQKLNPRVKVNVINRNVRNEPNPNFYASYDIIIATDLDFMSLSALLRWRPSHQQALLRQQVT
jgi:hypothetical protein